MLILAILIFIASFLLGGLILFRIYMDRIFNIQWFTELVEDDVYNERTKKIIKWDGKSREKNKK